MSYNVLDRADISAAKLDPFPYIVVDNALPDDVYQRLSDSYPDPERMVDERKSKNNQRYNLLSKWGATEFPYEDAPEPWREFTEANASSNFVNSVYNVFPSFKDEQGKIDIGKYGPDLATKIKVDPRIAMNDVVPRVTVAVNTPVTEMSSVRGAHVDHIRKAYVGLLYFRLPGDESTGGDLEIFRWKDGVKRKEWAPKVPRDQVEVIDTVEYKPNRLVLFLATSNSLHGVSPRSITPYWRRLVVISGWLPGVDYYDTDTMHGRLSGLKAGVKSFARRVTGKQTVSAD